MASGPLADLMTAIAEGLDDFAAELTEEYRAAVADYGTVVSDSFEANTAAVLDMAFRSLRDPGYATSLEDMRSTVTAWADQGLPLELVAHRLQVGARRLMEVARERAAEFGVDPGDMALAQDFAWQWATDHAAVIHEVHQQRALAQASTTADFMRRLVGGLVPAAELREAAARFHLDAGASHVVACARWHDTRALSELASRLRVRSATSRRPVLDAVVDGVLVVLLPQPPTGVAPDLPVGVSRPCSLSEIDVAYDEALRALRTAEEFEVPGFVGLGDLGALPLLTGADDTAAALLDARHLQPLRDQGRAGEEILATAALYLSLDRRVEECARRLMVHRNTVRYRLTRFTEVTRLDPERTDDLVVLWWLLHRGVTGAALPRPRYAAARP